jgi:CspA family cold shock protein
VECSTKNKKNNNNNMQGSVKFYNEQKGFGFIKENETGEEYFVHATGLIDKIQQDDNVDFKVTQGKKGMNAIEVKVIY